MGKGGEKGHRSGRRGMGMGGLRWGSGESGEEIGGRGWEEGGGVRWWWSWGMVKRMGAWFWVKSYSGSIRDECLLKHAGGL
ncbi:unnamed protein product [Prunus armeniaca]